MVDIREPTTAEFNTFYPRIPLSPIDVQAAVVDGEVVAMGGMVREPTAVGTLFEEDAPLVAFLDVRKQTGTFGVKAILAMRRGLKRHGVPVTVQCDEGFASAERLLRLLGFQPTDKKRPDGRYRNGDQMLRVWTWSP